MIDKIEEKGGGEYSSSFIVAIQCRVSSYPAGERKWVIAIAEYFCRNSYSLRGRKRAKSYGGSCDAARI